MKAGKRVDRVDEEAPGAAMVAGSTDRQGRAALEEARRRREMSFWQRGWDNFRQTLHEAAQYREIAKSPYGFRPVAVLTVISAISAVDVRILSLALPEVIRDLDLDVIGLIGVLNIVGLFVILIALGFSWLADRIKRAPFVGIGTVVAGASSLAAAGAQSDVAFGVSRGIDGVGAGLVGVPIASLNADYYPVQVRGKVFALTGVISRVLAITAPLMVAYLVTVSSLTWRLPYLITGPLLILAGLAAIFLLREPIRGYMERRALGLSEKDSKEPEDPVSFGEAWRTIWSIRTIRRLFISTIPGSMGDFIFAIFFQLLLFAEYGLTIRDRAFLSAGLALAALPFGFYAGGIVDVLIRRRPQRVLIFTGSLSVVSSLFLFVIATTPPFAVVVGAFIAFGCAGALFGPAKSVLFVQILPAHVRTMGSAVFLLAEIPGTIFRFFLITYVVSRWGIQGALFAAAPLILLSSLIELSAAGLFERDMRSALASQAAAAGWRKARISGKSKLLVCRDVDVAYDGVQVLFGVDFDVEDGDIVALLGTNGAGKSTLLRAINGTHEASSGAVVFNGRDITHMPAHEVAARGVVSMPGGRGVFPDLSVRENLMLGSWLSDDKEADERLTEVHVIFPILQERANERAQLLSGGEQQMLSLAMAFLNKPRLLIIDELALGLSPAVVGQLIAIVRRIHAQGTTVIVVEQSVNVALTLAERAIFMEKGEVRFVGQTEELLRRPDLLRAVYVKGTGALTTPRRSAVKSERDRRRYSIEQARAILDVTEVSKSFGGLRAVSDVSFSLREGESLGLIGPNGAGKTTIFDLISGYQIPDSGRISYEGVDITQFAAEERAKLGLVRRFQDARMFPSLSVYENILIALERQAEVRSIFLTAIQVPQARQAEGRQRRRADALIELLELGVYQDKFVKELSTGLRRITDLACVLATEPKLLLLDEPSTGIAQAEAENLAPLLRRVRHETGCSMLIIEHDMTLISEVSDDLLAMDQGTVIKRGSPDEVLNDEQVIASYLGTSENVIERSGTRSKQRRTVRSR